jgi:hypothetical protein
MEVSNRSDDTACKGLMNRLTCRWRGIIGFTG